MDPKNPYQIYLNMLEEIEKDNLSAIKPKLTELAITPHWDDLKQQLFYKSVIHSSHQIIVFMLKMYPEVLSDDTVFNLQILRHAVRNDNLNLVKVMLHNNFKLMINPADFDMYDCIIQDAFRNYYQTDKQDDQNFRAKKMIKFLIEYPRHQCHLFGIQLSIDEATLEIDLTISEEDINKMYDQKTVLEIYTDRMKFMDPKLVYLMQLFRNIVYCLVREISRLKMCKFISSPANQRVISSFRDLHCFAEKCEVEILKMRGYRVVDYDKKVSAKVSDLLAESFVKYSCTEKIVAVLLTKEFRNRFPIYSGTILRFVSAAVDQNEVKMAVG
ncbi:hypothetical protein KQX54_003533 [Cotesia glomerata]|uniref:Uncharacterized protein n=1 Tax=Cotesia glomerata TaxID=32391 RepID=A0AAV7HCG1_COTGL|nr:hypothetical protein KQX54_003533 [Cotesia glomerata]